jgi:hypothetical protein
VEKPELNFTSVSVKNVNAAPCGRARLKLKLNPKHGVDVNEEIKDYED